MASQRTIRVPVPEPFREFMGEVADLLREKAPPVTIESDDLLQGGCGYGGLSKDGHFDFVYFPPDGGSWTIKLSAAEIQDIADGRRHEIPFIIFERHPWLLTELSVPEAIEKLKSIGISGLSPKSTRSDIIAKLGPPREEGGPPKRFQGKLIDPWIKYWLPQCQVHFTFNAKGKVTYVQFLPADWSPNA
jgi:hypothetical protein